MARQDASDLARSLGRQAEAVCRHYLSSGRREGRYWLIGDVRNTPGRSMYVRLKDSPKGVAGKWTDAATGEHGDLLDVIRESCGLVDFKDVADEARTFLSMPPPEPGPRFQERQRPAPSGSPEAARRLIGMSQPITGTIVQAYLRERGITDLRGTGNLRFHPRCYYRPDEHAPTETWPAMIAAVTDLHLWTPQKTQVVFGGLARSRMLPSVRPLMQHRRLRARMGVRGPEPLHDSVLTARWKALVLPAPSRRLLCHTLLRPTTSSDDPWSALAYAAAATGAL
ncbi:DUF7146 domain-containing protein [Rhizobium brockwellii]|uniref:DUF7146 domain-containing protein n=1 Tax=Rhizobium brockwellii TaxID=3019932 RepID=UPI000A69B581|nr:hypothetical protein [Rhizobium brockwellii]